ncbi:MAG: zinc-ribbon domain-containing protein [Lachnospiraceae bacterium]|nr:zinc-ribbon domain-containing protein [Lachnospiraceae bacterium]
MYLLAGIGILWILICISFAVLEIVAACKLFTKIGRQWWEAIIPFYNLYLMAEKIFGNGLWFLIYFASIVPIIGGIVVLLFTIIFMLRLSHSFGQGTGFAVGLIFLSPIFMMILAFGDSQFTPLAPFDIARPFDFVYAGYNGNNQYTNNQYTNNQYANNQYANNQYANNQYANNQYANNQYVTSDQVASTTTNESGNDTSFCKNCGAALKPGQNFCTNCGTKRD